ncbi:right-handed parallel beta-helix repeat-containing protein [Flavivirga rizhaonensis]|nr:right-handed parallel beta-helix repeat-containing protein [Flavivirga rizhaonensis]
MKTFNNIYFLLALFLLFTSCNTFEIYVSPKGGVNNSGSKSDPMSFEAAIKKASKLLKEEGLPKNGLKITVMGGIYRFNKKIILGPEFKGTPDQPIKIHVEEGAHALFDGSMLIAPESFGYVENPEEKARLASSAVDKIKVATITSTEMVERFNESLMLNLSYDGEEFLPSAFPNEGYASFKMEVVVDEVSPPAIPVGKEAHGIRAGHVPYLEPGKPRGWKGSLKEPRGAQVNISDKVDDMAGSWLQWQEEINRNNTRNQLTGYIEANWLLSSQPIYAASAETKSVHLTRALGYGWAWRKTDKSFRVFGLLCELDQPGEWHFDPLTNRLFVYPPKPMTEKTQIALSVADGFLALDETSYVEVVGLSVKNVGSGSVYKIGGDHNLVASSKITNSIATGLEVLGTNNAVKGCDLIDLDVHVKLDGGIRSPNEITAGNNTVENCHIYQKNFEHEKVNIVMKGVGNSFRHNLIHNSLGQAMIVYGNDQIVEFNELFNIGYDEGDGGAIYSGADLGGYGNSYKYNFFHHLMHVPGKVERAGLHLDDGQSGATCIGNIFYKSASKGIFMFGGSGHTLKENVFLEGDRGAYYVRSLGEKMYKIEKEIQKDLNHHRRGTKEDYIGRVEKYTGINGWSKSPWKDKYPLMNTILSDSSIYGRLWPTHIKIESNFYYNNKKSIDRIIDSRVEPEVVARSSVKDNELLSKNDFVNYENMDFMFKDGTNFPKIPFDKMGLQLDEYRKQMPEKEAYRKALKEFFKDISSSHPGTKKRINTSKVIEAGPWLKVEN